MKVSTKGRYALRTMIDLTVNNTGNPIPLKDIATRQNISLKYIMCIYIELKLKWNKGTAGVLWIARAI